jgi:hypothetical protein
METIERSVKFAVIDNRIANATEFIGRMATGASQYNYHILRAEIESPTLDRVTGTIKFKINSRRDYLPSFKSQLEESAKYRVQLDAKDLESL